MRPSYGTFNQVFGIAYVVLMTNALLTVACLPLVVALFATDLSSSWPLLALLAPLCAPALVSAYTVFAVYTEEGTVDVARTFARAWRSQLRRSLAVGAPTVGVLVVLAVDVRAVWESRVGALAIPFFATVAVLTAATATLALVGVVERPEVRVRALVRAALYLAVRRWYLSAASLVVLGLLVGVVATRPAPGLGLAAAPLLYAVWANSRYAMRPVLHADAPTPVPA